VNWDGRWRAKPWPSKLVSPNTTSERKIQYNIRKKNPIQHPKEKSNITSERKIQYNWKPSRRSGGGASTISINSKIRQRNDEDNADVPWQRQPCDMRPIVSDGNSGLPALSRSDRKFGLPPRVELVSRWGTVNVEGIQLGNGLTSHRSCTLLSLARHTGAGVRPLGGHPRGCVGRSRSENCQ